MDELKTQDDFGDIFEYIDYLEFVTEYFYDELKDSEHIGNLVIELNNTWYQGD